MVNTVHPSFVRYHDEMENLVRPYLGQELRCREIVAMFKKTYPKLDVRYLAPSDHCNNHTNKGPCKCSMTNKAIFERVSYGVYKII